MKRIIVIVVVILILAGLGYFGYQQFLAPQPTPEPEIDLSAAASLPEVVSAEGFVVPAQEADLSFEVGGPVVEVLVAEGDRVEAGQVLIRLDSSDEQQAVAQAEAGVAQAEASLTSAQARLVQAQAGATDEAIAQAEAAVQTAQARLAQAQVGPTDEAIAQAAAAVETAKARLNQLLAGARPEDIQAASADLLTAQALLRQAQAEYDKIAWAEDVGETPQAIALEQATLSFEAAKAGYDRLLNGATAEEIAVARAGVAEAEAAVALVKTGPTQEAIAVAEAGVAEAKAALALVLAGPTDEDITVAEAGVTEAKAGVASAEAALAIVQAALSDFELAAPMAGSVARVNLEVGEQVSPGTPVISLGATSNWFVETDDLTEIDVIQVEVGQPVEVTVDAIPDRRFNGVVTEVAPRSETKRGDVTYTVTIELIDADDEPLRWGMTVFVDISVSTRESLELQRELAQMRDVTSQTYQVVTGMAVASQ
jgi:HlyD family secretion protein